MARKTRGGDDPIEKSVSANAYKINEDGESRLDDTTHILTSCTGTYTNLA